MASIETEVPQFQDLSRKTFQFDRVLSALLAIMVVVGMLTAWLGVVWLSNQVWKVNPPAVGVDLIEIASDGEEGMAGDDPVLGETQLSEPDELPLRDETFLETTDMTQVLSNVLDVLANESADFADPNAPTGPRGTGRSGVPGGTGKQGTGEGSSAVPRSQRWLIVYPPGQTLDAYARQLDFFGIEMAVVKGPGRVTYVSNFSKGRPVVKTGSGSAENRLYFVWDDAQRRKNDVGLLGNLGIAADSAMVVQFFPPELEEKLARLEQQHDNQKPEKIQTTRFGIRRTTGGYEFHVVSQSLNQER